MQLLKMKKEFLAAFKFSVPVDSETPLYYCCLQYLVFLWCSTYNTQPHAKVRSSSSLVNQKSFNEDNHRILLTLFKRVTCSCFSITSAEWCVPGGTRMSCLSLCHFQDSIMPSTEKVLRKCGLGWFLSALSSGLSMLLQHSNSEIALM